MQSLVDQLTISLLIFFFLLQLKKKKLVSEGSSSSNSNSSSSSSGSSNVPAISFPGKKKIGNNFDPNFLEHRLTALDKMMQQCCDVPPIFQDENLQLFLQPNREGDIPNAPQSAATFL